MFLKRHCSHDVTSIHKRQIIVRCTSPRNAGILDINLLKTKRRLLYLKTQSVPRCKHFSSLL